MRGTAEFRFQPFPKARNIFCRDDATFSCALQLCEEASRLVFTIFLQTHREVKCAIGSEDIRRSSWDYREEIGVRRTCCGHSSCATSEGSYPRDRHGRSFGSRPDSPWVPAALCCAQSRRRNSKIDRQISDAIPRQID